MESPDDKISSVISELIRGAASLNCKSIMLPLLPTEIPSNKKKNLKLKNLNAITNGIQQDNLNELQIIRVITDTKA